MFHHFPLVPNGVTLETSILTHGSLGNIYNPNYSKPNWNKTDTGFSSKGLATLNANVYYYYYLLDKIIYWLINIWKAYGDRKIGQRERETLELDKGTCVICKQTHQRNQVQWRVSIAILNYLSDILLEW